MSMFDSVISEASEKFNLGGKAKPLLSALLALMTDKNHGGLAGFIERFNVAGMGDTVTSWIGSGSNMPVSNEQLESALGANTLQSVADQTGTEYATASSAIGYMTPRVIDELTPEGVIPQDGDLLSRIGGYLTGGAVLGGLGTAAAMTGGLPDRADAAVGSTTGAIGDKFGTALNSGVENGDGDGDGSVLKWLLPLLLLGLLLAMGYMFCGKSTPIATTNTGTNANVGTNANKVAIVVNNNSPAVKAVDSSFSIKAVNGKYIAAGVVADEAAKKQIVDALTAEYGAGNVDFAGLKVDAAAKPFGVEWWENFSKMLPNLKDWKTGELSFVGNAVTVASGLPAAAIAQLKSLFAGYRLPVSLAGAETAAKQANDEALAALNTAASLDEVVNALNVSIINFASGSAAIPANAQSIIDKAAEVLKKQPDGATIEIGGHTDSDGDDAANQKLSQSRADAVEKALVALGVKDAMLTAKGYGEIAPVAGNDTPDNKFKNRRIEYKTAAGNSPTATAKTTTTSDNANAAK